MRRERAAYVSYLAFRGPVCPIGLSFSLESFVLVFFFLRLVVSHWLFRFFRVLLAVRVPFCPVGPALSPVFFLL